jgi:hypothetical protein
MVAVYNVHTEIGLLDLRAVGYETRDLQLCRVIIEQERSKDIYDYFCSALVL